MDNPNPIYYRDLITPDDSITKLIQQLDELISKYEAAKSKIQGAAAEAAKSMQGLSGATEEQREQITLLTTQSEKLAEHYAKYNKEEREAYRQKQSVIQATKEQQRIDKLMVEINNSKEGSYNRLSAQYRLNKIRLNEMSAAQRQGTQAGRELETETRKIYEEMSRLQKATGKYTLEVGHYENALRGLPGPIGQVVNGFTKIGTQLKDISQSSAPGASKAMKALTVVGFGVVGMLVSMGKAMASTIKTNAEFEQANADLSTILGVNRKDMAALTNSALELGRTTEYTARQVTQLQTELAKLGFGQGSIVNMEKPILQFATAVGANLADAASVAGSTLRAFGLTSSDTEDVLGTLAIATNNSALTFDRIKQSIGTVFPVANAFGLSVKDATALLGALANAGFDASTAATATRNILLKLVDTNGQLAKSLGGPAKNFDEIIDGLIKLRDAGTDLNTALQLTDRRSVSAFSALLSGADSARELRSSLEDVSGELQRIQEERLNTVEGSTKLLKSAWEGFTLALNESNGAIKNTIDWLTKLVTKMQELLFPMESGTQKWSSHYTEQFNKVLKSSAEEAKVYAENVISGLESALADAEKKLADTPAILATTVAKRAKAVENLEAKLAGAVRANGILQQQIKNNAEEAARAQALADQQAQQDANKKIILDEKALKAARKQRVENLKSVVDAINAEIAAETAGTEKMLQLRLDKVEAERQLELEQNRQKTITARVDESKINAKYDKMAADTKKAFGNEVSKLTLQRLQAEQQAIQLEIAITEDETEKMLQLRLANIEKQRQIEIEQNKQKEEKVRQAESAINAKYDNLVLKETAEFNNKLAKRDLDAARDFANAEFDLLNKNERQKTIFRLQQEKARLDGVLKLNETASKKMTQTEIDAIKATISGVEKEINRTGYKNIYELFGIGLDSEQQSALNTAIDSVKDAVSSIADAWEKSADAAVASADAQVEAAQKVLDAEIEARNAGYANDVATAQQELELARENREKALREQEKAQKAQIAMDAVAQSSSLITATANIWKALSGITGIGPVLAVTAIGTMWASFAASKIKAAQMVGTEKYEHGIVELLQGGSHASGHDIDLGTKPDGTRRRAEGGEYFAVINKRNSRRYGHIIPDVINSFNNGTFAEKYQRANSDMSGMAIGLMAGNTDVSKLENDVSAIRKQGDQTQFVDGNGNTVIRYRNLTRTIKN